MTEQDWMACSDVAEMLDYLLEKASDRKIQLFSVACCRRIWPFFQSPFSRQVVELVEQVAEGLPVGAELKAASLKARQFAESEEGRLTETGCCAAYAASSITERYSGERAVWTASRTAMCVADTSYWIAFEAEKGESDEQARGDAAKTSEEAALAHLLRHIIGNPFRPYPAPESWPSTVVLLAQALYDGQDCWFALHDALNDYGFHDLAEHFKDSYHPKGCWVLDAILGKK